MSLKYRVRQRKKPRREFSFSLRDSIIVMSYGGWSAQARRRRRSSTTTGLPYTLSLFISSAMKVVRYPPKMTSVQQNDLSNYTKPIIYKSHQNKLDFPPQLKWWCTLQWRRRTAIFSYSSNGLRGCACVRVRVCSCVRQRERERKSSLLARATHLHQINSALCSCGDC